MGPRPGRMHVRAAQRARGRRQRVFVPHRDAADLPAARLLCDLHVPAGPERLLSERLAPASVTGRRRERQEPAGAAPGSAFATPTVNGYRRFRTNSLAPDRAGWANDNRGAMIRVLGGHGDPATRLENRAGEPAANPYLYILSQVVTGLAGIEGKQTPPPAEDAPYAAERPLLPKSLAEALDALDKEPLFRRELGDIFVDYFVTLKRSEWSRFERAVKEAGGSPQGDEPTAWEE